MVADLYGATTLPMPGTDPGGVDPLLAYVVDYFKTIANAYALADWQSVSPGATAAVRYAFTHDPHETNFVDNKLPGLFLWRSGATEWIDESQCIRIQRGRLRLLWVPPDTGKPEQKVQRSHFPWKLAKLFDDYLELGRDPAWVVPGDPDPSAPAYGSVLARFANFRRLRFQSVNPNPLLIELVAPDGAPRSPPRTYAATLIELLIEEDLVRDPTRNAPLQKIATGISLWGGPDDPEDPLPIIPGGIP